MLHPVPDSALRARLLEVVELQQQLIEALCLLRGNSVVDQAWLQGVWTAVPAVWIKRFWENDKGNRATWLATIAAASVTDKLTIKALMAEQLRFEELYSTPPKIRLTNQDWAPPVFAAVKKMLVSFYAPLFYQDEGFPNPDGTRFHKEHFTDPRPKICPYTDNIIQDTKLDHFLPKDQFPMLSCHPDNLIPCSTDANSGSHKGTKVPLDYNNTEQAAGWFHPRLRSAQKTYQIAFPPGAAPRPRVQFIALDPQNQPRLDNLELMFGLSGFWGGFLDDEVQNLASDINGLLAFDNLPPTEQNVQSRVLMMASQARKKIGRDGLAIIKSFFYEHIANTPVLLAQIIRTCQSGI